MAGGFVWVAEVAAVPNYHSAMVNVRFGDLWGTGMGLRWRDDGNQKAETAVRNR